VRILRQLLLACLLAGVLGAFGSASALASNCGGAGNQQYIDPLQCGGGGGGGTPSNNHPSSGHSSGGSTGTTTATTTTPTSTGTSGTASDTTTSATTTATGPTSTTSGTSTSKSDPKSLPYTGLDLAPSLLIAVGLLGGGVVLRRIVAER
jgi:hypothetical protein